MTMSASDVSSFNLEDFTQLDDKGLRQRWRRLMGRPMPDGLGRALVLRVLAYQQQVQLYGDLDPVSRRALADVLGRGQGSPTPVDADGTVGSCSTTVPKTFPASRLLRPGTLLTREHGGALHRVMVMEQGFGWNGRTYDSLSKVAFAITGTRWNGPRFFGLRDKGEQQNASGPKVSKTQKRGATRGVPLAGASAGAMAQEMPL